MNVLSGAVTVTSVSLVKVIDQVPVTVALPSVARLPVPKISGGRPIRVAHRFRGHWS